MKKILLKCSVALWGALLVLPANLGAQSFAVVGNGTGFNTNTGYPAPYGNYWWGARHQFFVPASELLAAGMTPTAFINALGFNVVTTNNTSHLGWTITVYTTTLVDPLVTAYVNTGMVSTSTVTNYTPVNGWNMHNIAPFLWNGESLVIETCFNNGSYTTNANTMWTTNLSGAVFSRWRNADAPGQCSMAGTNSSSSTRPNIRFEWEQVFDCTGANLANLVISPTFSVCQGESIPLGLLNTSYSLGLAYQWQSSTLTPAGPFSNVASGGNAQTYLTQPLQGATWYQVEITCHGQGTTVSTAATVNVQNGAVTNTVYYLEDFENIGLNDRLPNCSWDASSLGNATRTYTSALSGNRIARSGNSYAAFTNEPGTHNYFTNGIQLEAGITYSVSMWYQGDLAGSGNFSNLRILLNDTKTSTGATQLAGVPGSVISPVYKSVSGTFSVSTPGLYHFGIEVTAAAGSAPYLVWDDFEVMIPCTPQLNAVTVNASATNADICSGQNVTLNASGSAHTYAWSTGKTGPSISEMPMSNAIYTVVGTNTITSCAASAVVQVTVRPTPLITLSAIPPVICAGQSANLVATGGLQYQWSSPGTGSVITVAPSTSSSFSVTGTAANLCQMSVDVYVKVNDNPVVNANTSDVTACAGDAIELNGTTPGLTYRWTLPGGQVLNGSPVTAYLYTSGVMMLRGTDANGCEGAAQINLEVETCTGINAISQSAGVKVYPNPANADFTVESKASISEIQIADLTGRVVSRTDGGSTKVTVATDHLVKGIYQVRVTGNDGTAVIRLVKE